MKLVIDIEANGLKNPTKIWVIVCKNIDTGERHIFRYLTENESEREKFKRLWDQATLVIGHNILDYDIPVIRNLLAVSTSLIWEKTIDTFLVSKIVDFSRASHSLESYGEEFGLHKGFVIEDGSVLESKHFTQAFFDSYSKDLENYCIRDVDITEKIYLKYLKYIKKYNEPVAMEHKFHWKVINSLSNNGFYFDNTKATTMLTKVTNELSNLDKEILKAFPSRLKYIRTIVPKATKFGTISLSNIPKVLRNSIAEMEVDAPFSYCEWVEFNPSSHKQIIEVLHNAGWSPTDKTTTHIATEREISKLKYSKQAVNQFDTRSQELYIKLEQLRKYGWKVNEANISTLPPRAPAPARTLARRILLESRRRTLTEWLGLVDSVDSRIRGKFYGIGAWTHRMAHQNPNTANIPNEFDTAGNKKLLGKEMRALWKAPKNRLLVGVDAEGIQLRIFAHYIDDPEFTDALVNGKKEDKSDPHSLNQRILGSACRSRAAAKRFIYALLLGAGIGKLAEILAASEHETKVSLDRLMQRYQGFLHLKDNIIPLDAKRGWFLGLDGRAVQIPGDELGMRRHLCMSGYLQNGEAVIMKRATLKWHDLLKEDNAILVNFVHDEWQTEVPNNMEVALRIAKMQAESLRIVGEELGLKCPLAGSYWNDDLKDYTIGTNWSVTH